MPQDAALTELHRLLSGKDGPFGRVGRVKGEHHVLRTDDAHADGGLFRTGFLRLHLLLLVLKPFHYGVELIFGQRYFLQDG